MQAIPCAHSPSNFFLDDSRRSGTIQVSTLTPPTSSSPCEVHMNRLCSAALILSLLAGRAVADDQTKPAVKKVDVGKQAPAFKIKDSGGKQIDLAELTAKGPVL